VQAQAAEESAKPKKPQTPPATPQPEVQTRENAFSTFSLNVSDVSYKLAIGSLQNGVMPDPGSIRVEEFVNAFSYHDPAPRPGARVAFAWERAHDPFLHNRDILRFAVQTAAKGRESRKPLNLVIVLDNSGSMERADRVEIVHKALRALASQLQSQDHVSVVVFARTAQLWIDGMAGGDAEALLKKVLELNPEGGTNLEDAMKLGYETAMKHFMAGGMNRVILLTDGAANLGNVEPDSLKQTVVTHRQKGIAFDCFGIGWEDYNDDLLEVLSRNGDGRYGFLNKPEQAEPEFAGQLAGALNVGASDVKAQVEFNPDRVKSWRQIGYAKHQLTKEQFRDNTVDASEIAAAEQGNALYVVELDPKGRGPIGTMRLRFKVPDTGEYVEQSWPLEYASEVPSLENAGAAMRLAVSAGAFGEWLSQSPFAADVRPASLEVYLRDVPESFAPDPRPAELVEAIRKARMIEGK
jgi:secreted protein with Ig-like and vWFA domain